MNLKIADDLYAAGDIVHYPIGDDSQRIEHWKVACQQGHVAGLTMAGQQTSYDLPAFFWSNQQGNRINYVGHATKNDEIIYDGDPEKDDAFLALYVQDGQIKAAAGFHRDQDIIAIRELLHEGRMPSVEVARKGVKWVDELKKA